MAQCTATSKRSGVRCERQAMRGQAVCYMHGGKSLRGPQAPSFSTGRHSRYMPERLLERYRAAAQDTDLLSLREDLALLDARLADVLGRVDTGEAGVLWRQARAAFGALRRAIAQRDTDATMAELTRLSAALDAGAQDYAAWAEVRAMVQERARLVEGERKRLHELQQSITVEKALTLVAALQAAVTQHVHDPATRAAIGRELVRIAGVEPARLP